MPADRPPDRGPQLLDRPDGPGVACAASWSGSAGGSPTRGVDRRSPRDVFHLHRDEVPELLVEARSPRARRATRRADLARFRAIRPAAQGREAVRGRRRPTGSMASGSTSTEPDDLRGTGASAGIVRGPAPRDADPGTISRPSSRATSSSAPRRTRRGCRSSRSPAGSITNTGGVLSHAAVVAREFGLPAVVGTGDATTRIADGRLVEIDGSSGDRAPPVTEDRPGAAAQPGDARGGQRRRARAAQLDDARRRAAERHGRVRRSAPNDRLVAGHALPRRGDGRAARPAAASATDSASGGSSSSASSPSRCRRCSPRSRPPSSSSRWHASSRRSAARWSRRPRWRSSAAMSPPERRGAAFGLFDMLVSTSAAIGPFIGGVLVGAFGWRSLFVIAVPVALFAAFGRAGRAARSGVGRRHANGDGPCHRRAAEPIDVPGLVLLAVAAHRARSSRPRGSAMAGSGSVAAARRRPAARRSSSASSWRATGPAVDPRLFASGRSRRPSSASWAPRSSSTAAFILVPFLVEELLHGRTARDGRARPARDLGRGRGGGAVRRPAVGSRTAGGCRSSPGSACLTVGLVALWLVRGRQRSAPRSSRCCASSGSGSGSRARRARPRRSDVDRRATGSGWPPARTTPAATSAASSGRAWPGRSSARRSRRPASRSGSGCWPSSGWGSSWSRSDSRTASPGVPGGWIEPSRRAASRNGRPVRQMTRRRVVKAG